MSATATYTVTMAELRGETQHGGNLWSNYGGPVQQMSGRYNPQDASGVVMPPGGGRPRSRHAMDYPPPPPPQQQQQHHQHAPQYHHRPPGPGEDGGGGGGGADPYDRYPHPSLMNIPSINSLKRSYSQVDNSPTTASAPYTEMVQDLRDDYKPNAHDQKLLAFKKLGDKHTIVDGKGRIHEMEIDAQLHGMFFLSEFPAGEPGHPHPTSQHPQALNAELTCYRRNLFQISGSLCFPQIPLSVMLETGETSLIKNMEVSISAIESVDGHPVRLIVIPWKTPPPNAPDVNQAPDQEPPPLPLIPWSEEEAPEDNGGDHYAIYPIGWRRLQFRIATANNGRRKELQQHFVLHLKLHGTLANGQKLVLSELTTAPIVVRGRSPRNFQARKEIPLLGSSAGSRGQTLVETGHGIVAQAVVLNKPPYDSRPRVSSMEVPRSAFTFSAGKQLPQSPMQMRSNSYPTGTWNPQSQVSMPHNPTTSYPTSSLAGDPYQQKLPLSGAPSYSTEPQEMSSLGGHQQHATSMPSVQLSLVAQQDPTQPPPPIRTQFATYTSAPPPHISLSAPSDNSLNVPRYVDNNPRPSKSPRHASHQSIHSASSISADTTSGEYRYGPPTGYASVGSSELSPQSQSGGGGGPSQPTSAQQQPPSQQSQYPPPNPQQQDNNNNNNNNPGSAGGASNPGSAPQQQSTGPPPPRDYYPSSQSWTSTAGESPAAAYGATTAGDHRPYAYPPPSIKNEHGHGQHPGGGAGTTAPHAVPGGYGVPHYAWNAT